MIDREIYKHTVDILVPVFNGFEYLPRLFDTLPKTQMKYHLIVIDDASNDKRVWSWLKRQQEQNECMQLMQNEENLGFVKTVNIGLNLAKNSVALVNTDVELPINWLERLMAPIFLKRRVASSTPFTNSGSICSFPKFNEDNDLYCGLTCQQIDDVFKKFIPAYTQLPTGIGFCMGMNKDAIQQVGKLDEEIFEKGYGEENDWCQRAIQFGWKNVHVENLFVWHKHGGSFPGEEKQRLLKKNYRRLLEKHPAYGHDVALFSKKDPVKIFRNNATVELLLRYVKNGIHMKSFSIFDTLITRKTATPAGIFLLMQRALQSKMFALDIPSEVESDFVYYRQTVEALTRKMYCHSGIQDITLKQIYQLMEEGGYLTAEAAKKVHQLEIETELENVIGIPENIRMLKEFLKAGEHVVLISDMYLAESDIRKMLRRVDPILCELPLYVSSESLKNKSSGAQFEFVKEREEGFYEIWQHIGDHVTGDYRAPKSLGISCLKTTVALLPKVCRKVLNTLPQELLPQQLTGLSRAVCLHEELPEVARMGAYIGAPILYLYVDWILRRATEMGITRLYFVARDGYPLKCIADEIITCRKSIITTKCIYGSRPAWHLSALHGNADDIAQILIYAQTDLIETVAQLSTVFGLTEDELLPFLPMASASTDLSNIYLRQIILDALQANKAFHAYVAMKNQEKRELIRSYFHQELDLSDEHFAFVELNGSGYTQKCIASLLTDWITQPMITFYYRCDLVTTWKECQFLRFEPQGNWAGVLLEQISHTDHGRTIGYECRDGRIVPLFDTEEDDQVKDFSNSEFQQGILLATRAYAQANLGDGVSNRKIAAAYFDALVSSPHSREFAYLADMPISFTGRGAIYSAAPKLTEADIRRIFYEERYLTKKSYRGNMLELSLHRMNRKQKALYAECVAQARIDFDRELWISQRFPKDLLRERIALYGAGIWGRRYYEYLSATLGKEVTIWVDRNAMAYRQEGLCVDVVECLLDSADGSAETDGSTTSYDQVLIGVSKEEQALEIREQLIAMGVPDEKILWVDYRKL